MRSAVIDILPSQVRRSLKKFGTDLSIARRKRRLTTTMMAERLGVSRATYARMEKGDPTIIRNPNYRRSPNVLRNARAV